MNREELRISWKLEESIAHIHGWDFSHIHDRYTEETDLPWDYKEIVCSYLKEEDTLLDIDTGGGEFLLTLNHMPSLTSATEGYPPNVELCKELLVPLGIHFKEASNDSDLPFNDNTFDIILNRHGNYDIHELYRILKPGGIPKPFHGLNLLEQKRKFLEKGFSVLEVQEAFRPIKFFDIGALVWFAKIIEWEFPDFSVDTCFERLLKAQEVLDKKGCIQGTIHRYLLAVKKESLL